MSIYKLDHEYTLEEAKNIDVNDITTHPFFKKHFAGTDSWPSISSSSRQMYEIQDEEQPHVSHRITHIRPDRNHIGHAVEIETQHYGRTKHVGGGRGTTAHEAMDNAVHTYTHPLKIKPLTESLAGKKPATASKLFAEAMEARLDEISKKTLGSYVKKAVQDKERHVRNATVSLGHAEDLMRNGKDAESSNEFNSNYVQANAKSRKRSEGISKAVGRLTKEDLDEVEAPANFWNAGMARMNPIQVSQKQPAEPGQFKATLTKSPKRLADQDSSLEGKPRTVRDETEATATSRGPKTIELTGDWHADVPDHQFDPKLDSETEYYPLFSQFKSLGAYPSGPARAWESEEIEEDELNEISKKLTGKYVELAIRDRDKHIEDATHARASADALQNVRTGTNYVADDKKRDLRGLLGDMERKARDKKYKRERGIIHALDRLTKEDLDEDELNEISKKTLASYATKAVDELGISANVAGGATGANHYQKHLEMLHAKKRARGIKKAVKKLSEDSASLMATATKDEKKAAEQDKKKPAEFKKLHDKHEAEVKSKMKELGEETLNEISKKTSSLKKFKVYTPKYDTHVVVKAKNKDEAHREACSTSGSAYERPDVKITRVSEETLEEGLFDPSKHELLGLWDEHARRSDAHGSGSRNEILKRIEDHVAKKHGQEGLKKMKLHTDLTNALKHSLSPDKGHLQAILGNMRSRCAMGV